MNSSWRRRLLVALAAAGVGVAAGVVTTAPTGCASDCGNNCPIVTAVIETAFDFEPAITDLAWVGPACPASRIGCVGVGQTSYCNRITVTADQAGACDVLIALYGRESMVVHLQFGPPSTVGCCKGYPVVGDWHFTIPYSKDGGIFGGDGSTDAVEPIRDDASADGNATDAGTDDGNTADGAAD